MSEGTCDVSIGEYDGYAPDFFVSSIVTARKRHECHECHEPILPKQKHERVAGKWDDELVTFRFCLPCREVADEFSGGGNYIFGELWPELEANWEHGAHLQACLNRLTTVAAKERLRNQWMKWKGLP